MNILSRFHIGLILSVGVTYNPIAASANFSICSQVFTEKISSQINGLPVQDIYSADFANYMGDNGHAFRKFLSIKSQYPNIKVSSSLQRAIEDLVRNEHLSTVNFSLAEVLNIATELASQNQGAHFENLMAEAGEKYLSTRFSAAEAKERSSIFKSKNIDEEALKKALGYMSHQQALANLVGPDGINNISPDSLVGRYIQLAKERLGLDVSYSVTSFKKGPGYEGRGGEKLVIAVDHQTESILMELMANSPEYLMQNHDANQGTLYIWNMKHIYSYAGSNFREKSRLTSGFIYPVIVTSSYEASNVRNYFNLGKLDKKRAKLPWTLKSVNPDDPNQRQDYCRTGGYLSCTHWFGEMAIGEEKTAYYVVPGKQQDDPYSITDADDQSVGLRKSRVGTYTHVFSRDSNQFTPIGNTSYLDRTTRLVWQENKGSKQMWEVLGDENAVALEQGEWANPGWVVYNLISNTKQDRVPVVFIGLQDATTKITESLLDNFAVSNIAPR